MTDSEKAEEYIEPIHRMFSCNNEHYTDEVIIQAYLDGLAEGRKEKCLEQNKDGTIRPCEVMKENAELKELHIQCTKSMSIMAEQIEKMKCCKNCKHYFKKKQRCFFYEMYSKDKKECLENHKNWELAE